MKSTRYILALFFLFFASLACNLSTQAPESDTEPGAPNPASGEPSFDTPDSSNQDSNTPSGTNNEAADDIVKTTPIEPGLALDFDNPSFEIEPGIFNTYKTSLDYDFSAVNGVTGTIFMDGATRLNPYATSLEFQTYGKAVMGTEENMYFIQVNGNEYIFSPDFGCISGLAGQQGNPFDIVLDTYGVLSGTAAFVGEDFINDVDTYIYEITNANIDARDQADLGILNLTEGWIYIAQDGSYVVRVVLIGQGVNEGLSQDAALEGEIYYEINFYDFNAPVSFEIPGSCTEVGSEDNAIPLPEDASDISQFGEIINFSTSLSLSETETFYTNEMPSYGCTDPEVVGDGSSMVSMNFSNCEFGSIQIILTLEDEGKTNGTIFTSP